jgi:hypothetical protein
LTLAALLSTAGVFAPTVPPGRPLKLRVELVSPGLRKQGVQLTYPQAIFK